MKRHFMVKGESYQLTVHPHLACYQSVLHFFHPINVATEMSGTNADNLNDNIAHFLSGTKKSKNISNPI